MTTQHPCPQCQKPVVWCQQQNAHYRYRPFCNQRCQLLDLGGWAEETYAIPADAHSDDTED